MFNTTTIPTMTCQAAGACQAGACQAGAMGACADNSIFTVCSVLSVGVLLAASMAEFLLWWLKQKLEAEEKEEEEEEEEQEVDPYCDKYAADFAALRVRELSATELKELNQKFVREQVAEKVEVIMTFDKATETFVYYTDQLKEVSYAILETVAQKFAIDYDCKVVLQAGALGEVGANEVGALGEAGTGAGALGEAGTGAGTLGEVGALGEAGTGAGALDEVVQQPTSSVFAKFKNYNAGKGTVPNYATEVVEQTNHFRYRGKIYEYENMLNLQEKKEDSLLDYTTYKNLLERKEK